jgi:hypothetical protein
VVFFGLAGSCRGFWILSFAGGKKVSKEQGARSSVADKNHLPDATLHTPLSTLYDCPLFYLYLITISTRIFASEAKCVIEVL